MQKRYIFYALFFSFFLIFIIFFLFNLNKNKKLNNINYDDKRDDRSTISIEKSTNTGLENNNNETAKTGEKISMIILKDTLTPMGATIIFENPNTISFGYDNWFRIDKKESGIWNEEIIRNDSTTNSLSYTDSKNKESKVKIDWTNLYGSLSHGEYRLVKKIFINNQNDENLEEITLYSEFSM